MTGLTEIDNDLIKERLKKLEAIRALGIEPYGERFEPTAAIGDICASFREGGLIRAAGRIMAMRSHGKSSFCDLRDSTGRIQLYLKEGILDDLGFKLFKLIDIGDIVAVEGELFATKTSEKSIRVKRLILQAKSLRPMPEKWHGLKDVETRFRQRYLDLATNEVPRHVFKTRSRVISMIRSYLDSKGYLEVETPVMQAIPGGAAGKPFKTHHDALGMDLYLRVAPELYLKRLLVGGFEKVYEINKSFRNEGISTRHNPEFTMLELYTAYHDVHDVMRLTEEIVKEVALQTFGTLKITFEDRVLDLSKWERVSFAQIMERHFGIKAEDSLEVWLEKLEKKGHKFERKGAERADISRTWLINLVGELLEPGTALSKKENRPVFVTDYFTELNPLAKKKKENPALSDRFELYIGGIEIANGYSELNDPIEQRQRLSDELKEKGKEATSERLDEDFLLALEYGMPPAGGLGIGIDRLVMVLANQPTIREVILFPQLKSERSA